MFADQLTAVFHARELTRILGIFPGCPNAQQKLLDHIQDLASQNHRNHIIHFVVG